ncbi:hypothetical protein Ancab_010841 [Ancistrocladus abbreviatus]
MCHRDEGLALLEFKNSLAVDSSTVPSQFCEQFAKVSYATRSWKNNSDCCEWDGVACDPVSGHVIGLDLSCSQLKGTIDSNSSLFLLHRLESLNLAWNDLFPSRISPKFGEFSHLRNLNLSCSGFSGIVPLEIAQLSRLTSLDLAFMDFYIDYVYSGVSFHSNHRNIYSYYYSLYTHLYDQRLEMPSFKMIIDNLTQLRELNLHHVYINSVVPQSLVNLSSLTSLKLRDCNLQGKFPTDHILHLPHLRILNIASNSELHSNSFTFNGSNPLEVIKLSGCNFSGKLDDSLAQPKSLRTFVAESCYFYGMLPIWLWNITQAIIIGGNHFVGKLPSSISLSRFSSLTILDLWGNSLKGGLPSWPFALPSLEYLDLSFNQFTDQPNESITNAQEDGLIQGSLVSLENRERFNLQANNSSSPQSSLTFLFLSSCNLSQFPGFLKAQENLEVLDLSNNKIQGELPEWLRNVGKDSLYYLNLSLNSLTGGIEHIHSWKNLRYIDLHSNKLHCQLPPLPLSTYVFSASENSLTGEIPKSICNLGNLELFDLSNNSFSGAIPQCLGYFSDWLSVLDLRSNKLHGILPTTFGRCYSLRTLELNGNNLEGHLPLSLVNCKRLEVIDLGNNKFNGTFPHWLGTLPQLQVLVLRSNYFHGHVRDTISEQLFGKLRILDVSNNNFTGILPSRLLKNFKAMINLEQRQGKLQYMFDGVTTVVKQAATDQLDAYGGSFFFTRILHILCKNSSLATKTDSPSRILHSSLEEASEKTHEMKMRKGKSQALHLHYCRALLALRCWPLGN